MRTSVESTPSSTHQIRQSRVKACAYLYLRVSKAELTEQENRLQEQKEAILKLAGQQGYEVIEWYIDDGMSGSKANKLMERVSLTRLLADAPKAEWLVVLCYDRSRLGRHDAITVDDPKRILIKAGKCLHTVAEGLFEWRSVQDRLLEVMQQEMQSAYATQLSHASRAGKLNSFLNGKRPGGKCPYGYACQITDLRGATHRISREEDFAVPRGWSKILVPGDPVEAEVVRWLFDTHASTDTGIAALAQQLNDRGVLSPTGRAWQASTVAHILANDIYVGDTRFGRRSSGQFARLQISRAVMAHHDMSCVPPEGMVRRNTHEAIISRELWDRVQEKLNRR